jgi:phytoene synthase
MAHMPDPFAHCEALVRAADRDRFLTALFAPANRRNALLALYAFNVEIARVREAVRDPLAGEIRLQWWSDVLAGTARGDAQGNPVAAALVATIVRYGLPLNVLQALIAARRFDLYDEPIATMAELEAYAEGASAGLIGLAARILAGGDAAGIGAVVRDAGIAHAIAGLLMALPVHAARGQVYLPGDILRRHGADASDVTARTATPGVRAALTELRSVARGHLAAALGRFDTIPEVALPALLPVAVVPAVLGRMERARFDPFAPRELSAWRRQWLIWRAARRPRRIFGG